MNSEGKTNINISFFSLWIITKCHLLYRPFSFIALLFSITFPYKRCLFLIKKCKLYLALQPLYIESWPYLLQFCWCPREVAWSLRHLKNIENSFHHETRIFCRTILAVFIGACPSQSVSMSQKFEYLWNLIKKKVFFCPMSKSIRGIFSWPNVCKILNSMFFIIKCQICDWMIFLQHVIAKDL